MCPLTPQCSTTQLIYAAEMNSFTLGIHEYLKGFKMMVRSLPEKFFFWKIILGKSLLSCPVSSLLSLFGCRTF